MSPPARRGATALAALGLGLAVLAGCGTGGPGGSDGDGDSGRDHRGPSAPATGLLLTDFGSDTVTFLDPDKDGSGRRTVRVGTAPYGVALGADGRAWVATAEGVAVVDTRTRARTALIPYRTRTGPAGHGEYRGGGMGIALAPDGRQVYVGVNVPGARGTLEAIDTRALEVTSTARVGRRPFDVDVSRDGREVYATGHDSFDVTVVKTTEGRDGAEGAEGAKSGGESGESGEGAKPGGKGGKGVRGGRGLHAPRRIEVAPYGTEGGPGSWLKPHYAGVRPSDGRLLLPFEGERLVVLDPATGRSRIEDMTANTHQHGTTVTDDGRLFVVGTGPIDPTSDEGPSLTVRAPDGAERVHPLKGPHEDVAVSRDGRTAYVTGGFTRDGYWNGLTVVDLDSGDTRRIAAGERPLGIAVLDAN